MSDRIIRAKTIHPNDIRNVDILAPPAEFALLNGGKSKEVERAAKSVLPGVNIDAKDVIDMQQAALREVESELQKTRIVVASIANAALCLYKMLLDEGYSKDGDKIVFPKELVDRMSGQKISIGDDEFGNRYVRVQDQLPYPTWEGRTDD